MLSFLWILYTLNLILCRLSYDENKLSFILQFNTNEVNHWKGNFVISLKLFVGTHIFSLHFITHFLYFHWGKDLKDRTCVLQENPDEICYKMITERYMNFLYCVLLEYSTDDKPINEIFVVLTCTFNYIYKFKLSFEIIQKET